MEQDGDAHFSAEESAHKIVGARKLDRYSRAAPASKSLYCRDRYGRLHRWTAQLTWLSVFPGAAAGLHNTSVALRVPASAAPDYDSLPIEKTSSISVLSYYAPAMSSSHDLHPSA